MCVKVGRLVVEKMPLVVQNYDSVIPHFIKRDDQTLIKEEEEEEEQRQYLFENLIHVHFPALFVLKKKKKR